MLMQEVVKILKKMFISGIDTAITCAFYPYNLMNEVVLLNHLERILNYDTERAKKIWY